MYKDEQLQKIESQSREVKVSASSLSIALAKRVNNLGETLSTLVFTAAVLSILGFAVYAILMGITSDATPDYCKYDYGYKLVSSTGNRNAAPTNQGWVR